jgi:hypothetical protein
MARKPYPKRQYPNWQELDPTIDRLLKEQWTVEDIAKDLGIKADTIRAHLRKREASGTPKAHSGTPEYSGVPQEHPDRFELAHQSTPEPTEILLDEQYTQEHHDTPEDSDPTEVHHGTLEGHQEVMEDISQSVPDAPHIGIDETDQSTPEHPSTPIVHPELSVDDSGVSEHSGVPARQERPAEVPAVHPGTPTAEDWELWHTIKSQWGEVEKMLSERHTRQALLNTPAGTPRHTVKKTYVVDTFYVDLIDRYAKEHSLDLKDVLNFAFHRFFEQEGYLRE